MGEEIEEIEKDTIVDDEAGRVDNVDSANSVKEPEPDDDEEMESILKDVQQMEEEVKDISQDVEEDSKEEKVKKKKKHKHKEKEASKKKKPKSPVTNPNVEIDSKLAKKILTSILGGNIGKTLNVIRKEVSKIDSQNELIKEGLKMQKSDKTKKRKHKEKDKDIDEPDKKKRKKEDKREE